MSSGPSSRAMAGRSPCSARAACRSSTSPAATAVSRQPRHRTLPREFAPDGRSLGDRREGRGKEIKLAMGGSARFLNRPSTIAWLDSRTGHVRREIEIPESYVVSLAFSPDGQAIAAGNLFPPARGIIRIFRLRDKQEIQTIETPCPWIEALAFTPDGKRSSRACRIRRS